MFKCHYFFFYRNVHSQSIPFLRTSQEFWPNVKSSEGTTAYDDFWDHEWTKHGTCTGLSQYDYFLKALNLIKEFGTESIISQNVGKTVATKAVRDAYGGNTMVTLRCSGAYISELYTCWTQVNGIPDKRTTCPSDVQTEDSCTDESIYIQSFDSARPSAAPSAPVMKPTAAPFISIANPGDLVIVEFNSLNPDEVVLASLVDIPSGFTFYVTDNGWQGTSFRAAEGTLACTLTSTLAAGNLFTASSSSCKLSNSFDLSTNGDQILGRCMLHLSNC